MSAPLLRDDAVDGSDERRCRRALAVQRSEPGAPVPLVLGVGRRLEGAPVLDGRRPPHPAPVVASGRGVAAVGRARREGEPARSTGGHRRAARGLSALRQPEGPRAALPDARGGPSRAARCAAPRHRLCGALALHALAVAALPPPWLPQAPTPRARSEASAAAPQPPGAPRPASGPSPDSRDDRTPVRRRRGVRGEGGLPGRVGLRFHLRLLAAAVAGAPRARGPARWPPQGSGSTPRSPCGVSGRGRGGGAGPRRGEAGREAPAPGGLARAHERARPARPAPGCSPAGTRRLGARAPPWPLWVAPPGRRQPEAPRRWQGQRVRRPGEGEDSAGRGACATRRVVVGPARPRAQSPTQASTTTQAPAAAASTAPRQPVPARWGAGAAAAAAARTEEAGRGPGQRGRRPRPGRSPAVRTRVVVETRRPRRARRRRPAPLAPAPLEAGSRLGGEGEAMAQAEDAQGWTVRAPPVRAEGGAARAMLQA